MSEYNKLKNKGIRRGRPRLSDAEKMERKQFNTMRQEARRRAHLVLQHRHKDEYAEIFEEEFRVLSRKK